MTAFDIAVQWTVFAAVTLTLALRKQLGPFHPTSYYLLFHFLVFCLRPTAIWALDFDYVFNYMQFRPTPEVLRSTLLASSFALVVFAGTYTAACSTTSLAEWEAAPILTSRMRSAFIAMSLVIVPLGLYSIFSADVRGVHIRGVFVMTGTSGYLNDAQQVFVSFTVLFVYVFRWRWYSFAPLGVFLFYRAGEGWQRWMMVYPLIFLMLVYLWERRRSAPPLSFVLVFAGMFFLFTNLTINRQMVQQWTQGEDVEAPLLSDEEMTFKDRFDTMDFANFDYLAFVIDTVPEKTHGYNYGAQHLQLFTEPIPRALWRGKPIGQPVTLVNWQQFGNTLGITVSVVGDGWISYGWIGVAMNMAIYGGGLALLYNWFLLWHGHLFRSLLFLLVCSILVQVFRDGSLVSMAKFLLFTTLPILLWWAFYRTIFRETDPPEEDVKS